MARGRQKLATTRASKNTPLTRLLLTQTAKLRLALREIAEAVGWSNTSTVAGVLRGGMSIPLTKIKPLAECLEIDPITLLQLAHPEVFEQMKNIFKTYPISNNEIDFVNMLRRVSNGQDVIPETDEEIKIFENLIGNILKRKNKNVKNLLTERDKYRQERGFEPIWDKATQEE